MILYKEQFVYHDRIQQYEISEMRLEIEYVSNIYGRRR